MDDLDGLEVGSCMKPPLMCLQESGALVTSILITPMLIAIGGQDGMTKVYDALTGELLRLFGDKKTCKERSRMSQRTSGGSETELNEIHQRFKVTTIGLDHDSIFIGLGELMMVWKIDRIHQPKPKKDLRSKVPGRVVSKRIGSSNFREIQDEVIDTQEIDRIKLESKEKEEELKRRYYGEFSEWMNEEELIEYMKMISIEENGNRIEGDEEWETWKETEVVGIEERDGRSDVDESSLVMRASGSGDGEFEGLKDELNLDDWPLMIEGRGARERRGSNGNSPWKKKKRWIQVD
ncbi:uncharacterized protein MELLADRAFT_73427 [Melampsora larici-populina 98AG31]|uniref:Uncharacterized protein n=1 Tax=Melampsora larici-populina (strain 98AG31 / pathotype 3-4-7) TaxID=747676 RepID=F4S808_MELLP|nr:uncharacterized protein MELLADRAFT_73427 [Melampsora larici-populina 98AG31]EGF99202.1 hypothetical protein MELLADRAFT_73427 [Melampsora larici-populina 98AG31]